MVEDLPLLVNPWEFRTFSMLSEGPSTYLALTISSLKVTDCDSFRSKLLSSTRMLRLISAAFEVISSDLTLRCWDIGGSEREIFKVSFSILTSCNWPFKATNCCRRSSMELLLSLTIFFKRTISLSFCAILSMQRLMSLAAASDRDIDEPLRLLGTCGWSRPADGSPIYDADLSFSFSWNSNSATLNMEELLLALKLARSLSNAFSCSTSKPFNRSISFVYSGKGVDSS